MSTISENIKALRKKYSLTQEQLGSIADVSDKAVSTWENGVAEPRMGAVRKMAEYFNISVSDILDSPSGDTDSALDPKAALLAREIQANADLKKVVLLLQKKPELVEAVFRLDSLHADEFELINSTMERFKGGKRRR